MEHTLPSHTLIALLPFFLLLVLLLFLSPPPVRAQSAAAPSPSPAGSVNITAILEKGGQYTNLIRLLNETQTVNQINQQASSSSEGMTVFAPTDNAFGNLPSGTLNNLTQQQHVELILYHVLPKFYTLNDLLTVSNPVRTLASDRDGKPFGLNFTGRGNQLNVSTGIVETQVNNALSQSRPLAVFSVDMVLLPVDFYRATPAAPPTKPPAAAPAGGSNSTEPADGAKPPANRSGRINSGFGLVGGILLLCMGLFF